MRIKLVNIGNSKGVRIPKHLLEEMDLDIGDQVEITAMKGEIKLMKVKVKKIVNETMLLSEAVLAKDWLRPEEDEAWADL